MQYLDSVRDTGIYTDQGDKIGEINDEELRQNALEGLNGYIPDDDERSLLELIQNDFEVNAVYKLLEKCDTHGIDIEKLTLFIPEIEKLNTDLDEVLTSLSDDLDDTNYDRVAAIMEITDKLF
jgi:hypothetical protein